MTRGFLFYLDAEVNNSRGPCVRLAASVSPLTVTDLRSDKQLASYGFKGQRFNNNKDE